MTACIGWAGDCPVYGDFHGCEMGNHRGRAHRCACGARVNGVGTAGRGVLKDVVNHHGTEAGHARHRRRGEEPCVECRRAHAAANLERKQRRRSA